MGRDSASGEVALVYGAIIKIPSDPSWDIMHKRLEEFEPDTSLFATAARSARKSDLADQGPEDVLADVKKAARVTAEPILVSNEEDEESGNFGDLFYGDDIGGKAIGKVLGDPDGKHGIELVGYNATSGYEHDDGPLDPVLVLQAKVVLCETTYEPKASTFDLGDTLPVLSDAEKTDMNGKIDQVVRAFGLETVGSNGWKLVSTVSCDPR